MSAQPEVIEIIRLWVRRAEHDMEAAKWIMEIEENCPYDMVCFHCQQAAEKYMKAILTLQNVQAPRTHDLEKLTAMLPPGLGLSVPLPDLVALNPFAVEVRYADDWIEPTRLQALEAISIANAVRSEARTRLPAEAL